MPTIINLNKQSLDIESIWVQVTCPGCRKQYNVHMDKPQKMKNCNCGKNTFYFSLTPMKGKVSVLVQSQYMDDGVVEIVPDDVEVEGE